MNQTLLDTLWDRMRQVHALTFTFSSRNGGKGFGTGSIHMEDSQDGRVVFRESGKWQGAGQQEFTFRNVLRWTLNRFDEMLTLEHLRFGPKNPVFLFHLVPVSENYLESQHAHLCGQDTYFGQLTLNPTEIELIWRILGPKKNEEIKYSYS